MSHADVWSIHANPEGGMSNFSASIETRKPKNKAAAQQVGQQRGETQ